MPGQSFGLDDVIEGVGQKALGVGLPYAGDVVAFDIGAVICGKAKILGDGFETVAGQIAFEDVE